MEDAFAIVLFVVVAVAAIAAVWALMTSSSSYEQIGSGGLITTPQETSTAAERETEIRQMLEARNARRAARGESAHDIDAELRALTGTEDPELREEVRSMVEATNRRRIARGDEPLDVEAEIDRRLRELG
jgi:hypothetical protein